MNQEHTAAGEPGPGRTTTGRRVLDLAEGILIGQRRYSPAAALKEMIDVSRRHNVSLFAVAAALLVLASGDDDSAVVGDAARAAAAQEWGDLLA